MYYVYILKSRKDNKLYLGYSSDLRKRIKEHSRGRVYSTKNRLPIKLIYYEAYRSIDDARIREKQLKYFGKTYKHLKNKIKQSLIYP